MSNFASPLRFIGLTALLVALAPDAAHATAGPTLTAVPAWAWKKGETTKWHLETDIYTPRGLNVGSVSPKGVFDQARTRKTHIVVDTACVESPDGKNAVLDCTFGYVGFSGDELVAPNDDKLPGIFRQWMEDLAPAKVEIVQAPNGRIKSFDLQGTKRINTDSGQVVELERMMLQRVFSAMELPLPAATDDYKRGWKQTSDSFVMVLPTSAGTGGAYELDSTAGPVSDNLLPITTVGLGKLSAGGALDSSTGYNIDDVTLSSQAEFDLSLGLIVWRGYTLDGRLTVNSQDTGTNVDFYQVSALQKVDEFLPNGAAPLNIMAARAPKRDLPPPELTAGLALTPFASLGMQPLYIPDMPLAGQQLGLPTNSLKARVEVDATGKVTAANVYAGYEALALACEMALKGATFTRTGAAYGVDVEVEFRAAPVAAPAATPGAKQ